MYVAGVVAEYNPFHQGHEYMLSQVREILGDDTIIVCAMSGSFVQRGECALAPKHRRAEAAVRCGADVVLELPLPWSLSSAEGFAHGAVGMLAATGVVTHLAFGSECGDIERLSAVANGLCSPELDEYIREEIKGGISYAAARQRAAERILGAEAALLSRPNDILGIEYLKAVHAHGIDVTPLAVRRKGAGHDESGEHEFLSASELRRRFVRGEDITHDLPEAMAKILKRCCDDGEAPVTMDSLETALLARLRMLPMEVFEALADAGEGLGRRLYAAVHEGAAVEEILLLAKSKRYALARLRRMLLCAALGIKAEDKEGIPPYLRVLALSERGRALWRHMETSAVLPRVTRPGEVKLLEGRARRIFELEVAATDFCALALTNVEKRRPGEEWRRGPYIQQG